MAYDFNGTNQSMQTATSPVSATPLTMACWFNSDSASAVQTPIMIRVPGGGASGGYMVIFLRGDLSGDPIQVGIQIGGGAPVVQSSTSGYSTNTWNHACAIFTNNTSRTIYLNGGNSATNTNNISITPGEIRIGASVDSSNNLLQYMDGRLAEVGIWNIALTAAEIASLADGMTCDKIRPQSLVFYAPLIRDLQDVRGGLTITNNNAATVATHPRVYA
jgi:hypothetical protein